MADALRISSFTSALILASGAVFAFGCNSTGGTIYGASKSRQSNAPTTPTSPGKGPTTGTTTTGTTTSNPTPAPTISPTSTASPTVGTGSVVLAWAPPTSGAPTSYSIESSANGTTFTVATSAPGTSTSTTLTNVVNGTTYYFRMRSYNLAGYSAYTPVQEVVAGP